MPNDDQPRDELGRFTFGEGGAGSNTAGDQIKTAIQTAASDKPVVATGRKGEPIRVGDKALVKTNTSRKPFEAKIESYDPNANTIRARIIQTGESTILKPWEILDKK